MPVLENQNDKLFRTVTKEVGDALSVAESSRGAAFDDLDNDGDIDAVVLNCDSMNQVLENRQLGSNDWIGFRLVGTQANRSAVGAKLVLKYGGKERTLWKLNGRGYQSFFGERLHIGLGSAAESSSGADRIQFVDEILVYWPGASEPTIIKQLAVDQYHDIIQPNP